MEFLHCWAVVLGQIFRQIVSIRVMTLINTNVVASRHIKGEEVLLPVAVRHSKTLELNLNFKCGKAKRLFWGVIVWLELYPSRRSEKVNFYFANYRFSFRKLQILISQTTDSHFANYRFSFRKLQILISQTTDFHFANYRFSFRKLQILISQTTDFHFANYRFSFRFVPFHFAPFRFANSKPCFRFNHAISSLV